MVMVNTLLSLGIAFIALPFFLILSRRRYVKTPVPGRLWLHFAFFGSLGVLLILLAANELESVTIPSWVVILLSAIVWGFGLRLVVRLPRDVRQFLFEAEQHSKTQERSIATSELHQTMLKLDEMQQSKKEAEKSLRREKAVIRTLMDQMPDYIFVKDKNGQFKDVNKALLKEMGLTDFQQAAGKTDIDFFPPKLAEAFMRDDQKVIQEEKPMINRQEVMEDQQGKQRTLLTTKLPLIDDDGEVIGIIGISRDITDLKRQELALQEARHAAEAANRAKSEFMANMSHELRTPLHGIMGMTELALDMDLTSQLRQHLETVDECADTLLMIVNDILDFSKIESGKFELDHTNFLVREVIEHTVDMLANRAHAKKLELISGIDPDVPDAVIGDPVRLRQIVTNLIGNAIKFTESGEVALRVSIASLQSDRVSLHFSVRDTGIGIPEKTQRKIFEAFTQADTGTTRKYGGTGLGLTISSHLVSQMGGTLEVRSKEGHGSEFFFTITLELQVDSASRTSVETPEALHGTQILLVDDNGTNLAVLQQMLTNWQMNSTAVTSPADALNLLKDAYQSGNPYPMMITDLQMPDMTGIELVKNIRETPEIADTTVLMLTSSEKEGDSVKAEQLNISAFIRKPCRQSRVLEAILNTAGMTLSKEGKKESGPVISKRLRILLAEDSPVNQTLVLGIMKKQGHEVVVTNNGNQAVEKVKQDPNFDLVLMDVQMPGMDGFVATRAIRHHEKSTGNHVLIIAMTAHAMKGDRERCLAAGMDAYVPKPIKGPRLLSAIKDILDGKVQTETDEESIHPMNNEVIDWKDALKSMGDDEELLKHVVRTFLDEGPDLLKQMREGLENQQPLDVQFAAHKLKSSTGLFGAHQAGEHAHQMETFAKSGTLTEEAQEEYRKLCAQLEQIFPALKQHIE